jgi:CBS domain-containing protein
MKVKARELMTPNPCCCSPSDSAEDVARMMRDYDCGSVPVVDNTGCLIGIVTDRDLAVRGLAEGKGARVSVSDLMTAVPHCCTPDDSLADVEREMATNQVRRVPVVDADGCCVGIIAQADLARAAREGTRVTEHEVAIIVERISEPANVPIDRGTLGELEYRI